MPKRLECFDGEMIVIARLLDARNAVDALSEAFRAYRSGITPSGDRAKALRIETAEDKERLAGLESKMTELAGEIIEKVTALDRSPGQVAA